MPRYIYIGLGGAVGAILRCLASQTGLPDYLGIPFAVILINILGCFAIGLVLTLFIGLGWNENIRAGVSIGFLGGFTTFSTACKQMFDLIDAGSWLLAFEYAAVSVALGFAAAYLGTTLGRAVVAGKRKAEAATNAGEGRAE